MQRGPSHGTEPLCSLLQSWRGNMKEIASLVAVSMEEGENASWSLWYLISSEELSEANIFWDEAAEKGKDKVPYLVPPAPCAVAGWIQITNLMGDNCTACYAPRCYTVFSSSSKVSGNS